MVSAELESVNFEVHLCRKLDDIVSSPTYLVEVNEALLDTDMFLEAVT